ncbi:MAG: D-alanine--D-alanine ligase [Desulfomonile tiedjei]|nr:D-alanine--D-alanine ligase [Desulfomonile tiedjei]
MRSGRLVVALIFGGRSAEHEVSLRSAASVFQAMDKEKYHVIPVLITQHGAWYRRPAKIGSFQSQTDLSGNDRLLLSPDPAHKGFLNISDRGQTEHMAVDVVFPVLHGTYGEDGTLQGLLELANVPYVGCGVLASAVGMDKVIMKGAFRDNGLEVGPFFWFLRREWRERESAILEKMRERGCPLFVKPANLGSSVGITKVEEPARFAAAVELAASYDRKILIEDAIVGRELEVSVLGNDLAAASVPGEVISHADFYDYEEKYLNDTAELVVPADLKPEAQERARSAAIAAFRAVDGSGLARVDMFLTPDDRIIVNEINTLPGFTSISMYPKLWEATGISYARLIDDLVDLALERHRDKQAICTDRTQP